MTENEQPMTEGTGYTLRLIREELVNVSAREWDVIAQYKNPAQAARDLLVWAIDRAIDRAKDEY